MPHECLLGKRQSQGSTESQSESDFSGELIC